MAVRKFKGKENINTLLNIDTVFGEYEGRVMPLVLTLILAAVPLLFWLFMLQDTPVKFWYVCVFDVFWSFRWGLIILGKEKEKMKFYNAQRGDEYKTADELIHINYIRNDGLIEYDNGTTAVILSGYLRGYLSDDKLSVDMENFMNELDNWGWDMYLHNTVDEILCTDGLPKLKRYSDFDVIKQRISFYNYQDEFARTHTGLYRVSFLVYCPKYNWKKMLSHMQELVTSELALMFNEIEILNYYDAIDLLNRDICGFADINRMLVSKYDNENYYKSKVVWYDDDVPEELVPEQEEVGLDERRS